MRRWVEKGELGSLAAGREAAELLPRSRGEARLGFKRSAGGTALDTLYQAGCLRVRLPRPERAGSLDAVVINTGGGLTGGDEVALSVHWRAGTIATVCSQAAEKIYRSSGRAASVANRLSVEAGANSEWLPQETIVFNRASLARRLDVRLEPGASFLGLEAIVFGRAAMGEDVVSGSIRDACRIYRAGSLLYADVFQIDGAIAERLHRNAVAAGARAFATLVYATESPARGLLDALRLALARARGRAAASQ